MKYACIENSRDEYTVQSAVAGAVGFPHRLRCRIALIARFSPSRAPALRRASELAERPVLLSLVLHPPSGRCRPMRRAVLGQVSYNPNRS